MCSANIGAEMTAAIILFSACSISKSRATNIARKDDQGITREDDRGIHRMMYEIGEAHASPHHQPHSRCGRRAELRLSHIDNQ